MQVTWHPGGVASGASFVAAFTALVALAVDTPAGGPLGVVGGIAFVVVNVALLFNPAMWKRR